MASKTKISNGKYRSIRSDTKVATIEKRYDVDLGVRSDTKIGNYLKQSGYPSLSGLLRDIK